MIAAGPAVNLLIAFVILFGLAFGVEEVTGSGLEVGETVEELPRPKVLQEGDRIISIDGQTFTASDDPDDRAEALRDQIGDPRLRRRADRGLRGLGSRRRGRRARRTSKVPVAISPEYDEAAEQVLLGVAFQPTDFEPADFTMPQAAEWSVDRMWFVTSATVSTLAQLFKPEKREQISGRRRQLRDDAPGDRLRHAHRAGGARR